MSLNWLFGQFDGAWTLQAQKTVNIRRNPDGVPRSGWWVIKQQKNLSEKVIEANDARLTDLYNQCLILKIVKTTIQSIYMPSMEDVNHLYDTVCKLLGDPTLKSNENWWLYEELLKPISSFLGEKVADNSQSLALGGLGKDIYILGELWMLWEALNNPETDTIDKVTNAINLRLNRTDLDEYQTTKLNKMLKILEKMKDDKFDLEVAIAKSYMEKFPRLDELYILAWEGEQELNRTLMRPNQNVIENRKNVKQKLLKNKL